MSPLDDLLDEADAPIDDGVALLFELAAAVSWLRRGAMPGLTVWDAIEQAIGGHLQILRDWGSEDPLRNLLGYAVQLNTTSQFSAVTSRALRSWLDATRTTFNESVAWPSN
jgi:hypothetical protein